ncbi:MAG: hypothetical protein ACK4TL_09600 [Hyphomicrobiaceae bacterium]
MSMYQHHVLAIPPKQHAAIADHIRHAGSAAIAGHGGRLFGIWKPLIGLSLNHLVVLAEWPEPEAAVAHGADILNGIEGARVELRDLWTATLRPAPGTRLPELPGGYYSHRHYDIVAASLPAFLEHSAAAWGSFEGTHASQVIGLWQSSHVPAPGIIRMRLMAWYQDMAAWERSRYWKGTSGAEMAPTHSSARARP